MVMVDLVRMAERKVDGGGGGRYRLATAGYGWDMHYCNVERVNEVRNPSQVNVMYKII